jgi:hypothetical protein
VCDVYGKRRTDGSTTAALGYTTATAVTVYTKSLKNLARAAQNSPPPSKKISLSDRGPSRQTATVPKHSNYLILFLIFVPTLTF